MIKYYRTMDHQIHEISEPMEGTWISLIHPTAAELAKIATDYKIDIDDLRAPLDEEERSHIEVEEGYTLFIVDVPTTEERKEKEYFLTIPCGIILTEKVIITVCLEDTAVLADFKNGRVRNFWTFKRTRFICSGQMVQCSTAFTATRPQEPDTLRRMVLWQPTNF